MRRLLICLALGIGFPHAFSQCVSLILDSPLVSDRYQDAVQSEKHVILANPHGLVFKNLSDLSQNPLHVEPIPGIVGDIFMRGNRLYVTAKNEGLFIYEYRPGQEFPVQAEFYAIENLRSTAIHDNYLFADVNDGLIFYKLGRFGQLKVIEKRAMSIAKLAVSDRFLFVLSKTRQLRVFGYGENGFQDNGQNLLLDGDTEFYDMDVHEELLILDSFSGIKWLEFSDDGRVANHGYIYNNPKRNIVLDSTLSEGYLALRFADRLELFTITANRGLNPVGTLQQSFFENGIIEIVISRDNLYLLNNGTQSREWSLRAYHMAGSGLEAFATLEANFEELTAASAIGDLLYLGSNRKIYLVDDVNNFKPFKLQTTAMTLAGDITHMIASEDALLVSNPLPRTPYSEIHIYQAGTQGELNEVFYKRVEGNVTAVHQAQNQWVFVQKFRSTQGDHFNASIVKPDAAGNFHISSSIERTVAFDSPSPFSDIQMSDLGLVYFQGSGIRVHPDTDQLGFFYTLNAPDLGEIVHLFVAEGLFWIETETGLELYKAEDNQSLTKIGVYPHWHNLLQLPNQLILAQSRFNRIPSRYYLLKREEEDLIRANVAFSTSTEPIFISQIEEDLLVAEKTSLNLYQFLCPNQDTFYILPFTPLLELELATDLDERDVVTMTIFNSENQIIGMQELNADLIDAFNGKLIREWLFDFNSLEDPNSIILFGSKPLAPVISGTHPASPESRFAYAVPPWGENDLYVPHIPKNFTLWSTDLYIRNFDESSQPLILLQSAGGDAFLKDLDSGETTVIPIEAESFPTPTPWIKITAANLETFLSGFSLMRNARNRQVAAVPLVSNLSDLLVVPYLAGFDNPSGWTGLVLANPNNSPVNVRVIGYGSEGAIVHDQTILIPASDSLVVNAEAWLEENSPIRTIQWLALAAEFPIMGIVLYGDFSVPKMAGLPLSSESGNSLMFSGLRNKDEWRSSLVVTNLEVLPTLLHFKAYDGRGRVVATSSHQLLGKKNVEFSMAALFPDQPENIASIQSIRLESQANLTGFTLRKMEGYPSLEAIRAVIEE